MLLHVAFLLAASREFCAQSRNVKFGMDVYSEAPVALHLIHP